MLYYKQNGITCRKYLDIKSASSVTTEPDIIFICLNPGSCKPDKFNLEISVIPDPTILQLSKLIDYEKINFIRLLNLSNCREPNSKGFLKRIKEHNEHSIFNTSNNLELKMLIPIGSKIIFAWGVDGRTIELASLAISRLSNMEVTILNEGNKYYHPLPRGNKRTEWVENTALLIKKITPHF